MKKIIVAVLLTVVSAAAFSQEQPQDWVGTIRFSPYDLLSSLEKGVVMVNANWTQYVSPNIGIPVKLNMQFWSRTGIGFLAGIEYVTLGDKDKNGLFLDAKLGFNMYMDYGVFFEFVTTAHIGYQIITDKRLVFTPAAGISYSDFDGIRFDLMLDLGFYYKK